jgi:hypothetical protein
MLAPYCMLMEAANAAAAATLAAKAAQPSEGVIAAVAAPPDSGMQSAGPGGAAARQASSRTNAAQLQRWAPAVANMQDALMLVMTGFQQAQAAVLDQCEPLVLPYDV